MFVSVSNHADMFNALVLLDPCDNLILGYFGASKSAYGGLDDVGEAAFQRQLWQCMISQALAMDSDISARRSTNAFGIVTWQLNEIWPTGGWGSLEYGTCSGTCLLMCM